MEDHLGSALAVPLMRLGLLKAGSLIPKSLHVPAIRYAKKRRLAMQYLSSAPQTLVHHDCHPGNLFWINSLPGFLDWQMVRIGEGVSDVAYFLATALASETRRQHELELLASYCRLLLEQGLPDIDLTHLLQRYRAHLVYPFEAMMVALAVGGLMDRKSNLELIWRTASAVEDLESFSALPLSARAPVRWQPEC